MKGSGLRFRQLGQVRKEAAVTMGVRSESLRLQSKKEKWQS